MEDLFNIEYLKNNVEVIPLSTAIFALFGLLITTFLKMFLELVVNKKKIKADVISKSRVEWIQDIRAVFSEYFVMLDNLILLSQKIHNTKEKINILEESIIYKDEYIIKRDIPLDKEETLFGTIDDVMKDEDENYADVNTMYNKKINQLVIDDKNFQSIFWEKYLEFEQKHMLIELYLPDKPKKYTLIKKVDEHRIIKDKINNIINLILRNIYIKANKNSKANYINSELSEYILKADEGNKDDISFKTLKMQSKDVIDYVSQYLKKEWNRTKKNK
ncbi:hypothetical protein H0243_03045 [Staphylococcus sciuri]|uniref:hypothetical protein n=1 Tax=Mammaliicoccus sciuri TaxID=1296 RepID=UPI00087827DC|nr:hypothetical protein [Mammaliicoccus sciuri]MBG9204740.1 hypothetical protein [Mammaliicoccus sciuri]